MHNTKRGHISICVCLHAIYIKEGRVLQETILNGEEKNKCKVANLVAVVNTDINVYKDRDFTVSDLFIILLTKQGDSKTIGDKS